MTAPTRRRWFQFGLGTLLLLITVLAVWLGNEVRYVQHRKEYLAQVYHANWTSGDAPERTFQISPPTSSEYATISHWRALLGDEPVDVIVMPHQWQQTDLEAGRGLFPDALFYEQGATGAILIPYTP